MHHITQPQHHLQTNAYFELFCNSISQEHVDNVYLASSCGSTQHNPTTIQSNPTFSLPSIYPLHPLCLSPSHSKTLPKHTNARIRNSNKPARSMFLMPHILLLSPSRHKKDKESIINAHKKLSEEQDVMNDFVAKKSASSSSKIIHSFIQVFYSESKKRTSRIQKKR
jgi:hypothetical protein